MHKEDVSTECLKNSHDILLSDWGPYTKKYIGISHISDKSRGLRFDLSVFPGFYRRKVDLPNVTWESGYHPWDASGDLEYFSIRHELEWKDRVYCDISYSKWNESGNARLIRFECVNTTSLHQNVVLHYMASINFPNYELSPGKLIQLCGVKLPDGAIWIDALDYDEMEYAIPRPNDNLMPDGLYRGEVRDDGFVNGSGLGRGFGKDAGDTVHYCINIGMKIENAVLLCRFRMEDTGGLCLSLGGDIRQEVMFEGGKEFKLLEIPVGDIGQGSFCFSLTSKGGVPVQLDGFVISAAKAAGDTSFVPLKHDACPQMIEGPVKNSIVLKYENTRYYYGITWLYPNYQVREFFCDNLDSTLRYSANNHIHNVFRGQGDGHYTNIYMRPIPMTPNSKISIFGMVCSGSRDEVARHILDFSGKRELCEQLYDSASANAVKFKVSPEGQKYLFSQQRMSAVTLTNIAFPIYTKRSFVRNFTPGKWWDCLYTWDAGFIGLGLTEISIPRAIESLNSYVTEADDMHSAFIQHGSPVPVQIYLFHELWNMARSRQLLEFFYPRLCRYHKFLCGSYGSSSTRNMKSNLIKTWDYFYNSGGWDDYPPQVYVHKNALCSTVTPVVNTAHCIRTAKILRMAALELGLEADVQEYDKDIEMFTDAIQNNCWDEKSGYFGYVSHDNKGMPLEILRHESGVNFDMGLDGVYPLVAGICNENQEKRLLGHLMSEEHLWTGIGLSTVDRSAPYYRTDGYWNGAVWMPHQWFIWKTMLDLDAGRFAFKIAKTAIDLWKKEADETYNCYEHFLIESSRGAGWHHFSALSSPVLKWFAAYYKPGNMTVGFDSLVETLEFSDNNTHLISHIKIAKASGRTFGVVASMNPYYRYRALWNDNEIKYDELIPGVLHLHVPSTCLSGVLQVIIQL